MRRHVFGSRYRSNSIFFFAAVAVVVAVAAVAVTAVFFTYNNRSDWTRG